MAVSARNFHARDDYEIVFGEFLCFNMSTDGVVICDRDAVQSLRFRCFRGIFHGAGSIGRVRGVNMQIDAEQLSHLGARLDWFVGGQDGNFFFIFSGQEHSFRFHAHELHRLEIGDDRDLLAD